MSLPSIAVKRPITMLMLFIGIILIGIVSLLRLPVELLPNISFHRISIIVNVRGGMPPTEVETLVTKPVEEAVSTVSYLNMVRSLSEKGRSMVMLTFEPGTDMDFAALEVREKFAKVKNKLPKEIEKPVIAKYEQTDLPIMILAVTSDKFTTEELRKLVDEKIKERLMRVGGVANIEVGGGRERKILVEVDQPRLQAYGMSINRVTSMLGLNNMNLLTGEIERSRNKYLIRAIGEFRSLDDIRQLGLATTPGGSIIRLKDVADVKDSYLDPTTFARVNVQPVVSLYIQKETTANTIEVAEGIDEELGFLRKSIDSDIRIMKTSNDADFIKASIKTVVFSLCYGAVLAVVVLLLFLRRWRATLIIAFSIPISVIAAFFLMERTKITLNTMTLSGLALGIGMLVDNSIVVLENIFRRHAEGRGIRGTNRTAVSGAEEMLLAIVASTITTIVVFLPLVFVSKQIKLLYSGLALTVTFSLLASLFVALTLNPLLCAKFALKKRQKGTKAQRHKVKEMLFVEKILSPVKDFFSKFALRRRYQRLLGFALRHRYAFLGMAALLFAVAAFGFTKLDMELMTSTRDHSEFTIFVELPSGAKLEISDEVVKRVEAIVREVPDVKTLSSRVEGWSSKVYVTLVPFKERQRSVAAVMEELRPKMASIKNAFIYFSEPPGPQSSEVFLNIYGYNYKLLKELAISIGTRLSTIKGLVDIKMRYREGRPEMRFNVDKLDAALFEFSTRDIAELAHVKIRGLRATVYHTEGKEIETIDRLKKEYRTKFDDLRRLTFAAPNGENIYLEQLAEVDFGLGPSEIWRQNKRRMIQVSATTTGISLEKAVRYIKGAMADLEFPKDYYYEFGEEYRQALKNKKELTFALILTILLIYMVLGSLFESYTQPFIIMFSVPLASIGAVAALWMTFKVINMGALMGIIMLFGIVVNNAIILIDYINRKRREGRPRASLAGTKIKILRVVVESARARLRPILMTTSTTILGLMPMAVIKSEASILWAPLAITVIGGLAVSTVLSLFFIPAMYLIFEDIGVFFREWKIFDRRFCEEREELPPLKRGIEGDLKSCKRSEL